MLVLDDTAAAKLPLGGRAVFRMAGHENVIVQTPYLGSLNAAGKIDKRSEAQMIESEIKAAIAKWRKDTDSGDALAFSLFRTLLDDYAGKASYRLCLDVGQMSEKKLRPLLQRWDYDVKEQKPIIELDGNFFILANVPQVGGYGRWVIPIDSPPVSQEEVEAVYYRCLRGDDGEMLAPPPLPEVEGEEDIEAIANRWLLLGADSDAPNGGSVESADNSPEVGGAFFNAHTNNHQKLTSVSEKEENIPDG
jgi:hypothetical protein